MSHQSQHTYPGPLVSPNWWLVAAVAGVLVYAALVAVAFGFVIDDTFISMRYADNLAQHGELVWNLGEQAKVEGYSNLLWILLMAPLFKLVPTEPLLLAKLLSAVFGGATLAMFSLLASQLLRSRTLVIGGTLLLAVSRPLVLWGSSGMETTLYTFLVCTSLYLLLKEDRGDLSWATPVFLFLICLTRPEGVVFFAAAFAVRMYRHVVFHDPRYSLRNGKWLGWNAAFFLLLGIWLIWKYSYYGSIIPLPVHVKGAAGAAGFNYVKAFVFSLRLFGPLALIGIFGSWRRLGHETIVVAVLFYFAALCAANPTIMGLHFRLIIAALPLVYLLALLGLERVIYAQSRWPIAAVGIVVCTFLMFRSISTPWTYPGRLSSEVGRYSNTLINVHIPLGKWLGENEEYGPEAKVALADAGASAFYGGGHVIDFYGLNDVEFAQNPMTPDRLLMREPDFIILKSSSVEKFVGSKTAYGRMSEMIYNDPAFQEDYRDRKVWSSTNPFYCLWLFERQTSESMPKE